MALESHPVGAYFLPTSHRTYPSLSALLKQGVKGTYGFLRCYCGLRNMGIL
jgi:hypothetical protein